MSTNSGADSARSDAPSSEPPSPDANETAKVARKAVAGHPLLRGFAVGVALTVAMAIFIFQNGSDSNLEWLWMDFTAPLWQALLVAFLAGAVASPLLALGLRHSLRRRREQKKAVDRLTTKRSGRSSRDSTKP